MSSNPGPAVTTTINSQSLSTKQALRLIAVYYNLPLSNAGDFPMAVINCSKFIPTNIITANSSGTTVDIHLATVGVYTAISQGGTAILATAALTSQTTAAYVKQQNPASSTALVTPGNVLYVNIGTTVSGGVCDLFVFGYDLSD